MLPSLRKIQAAQQGCKGHGVGEDTHLSRKYSLVNKDPEVMVYEIIPIQVGKDVIPYIN